MEKSLQSTQIKEFHVHLENIFLRLLISSPEGLMPQDCVLEKNLHSHVSAELFVCGAGKIILNTKTGMLILESGDAALISPGMEHTIYKIEKNTVGHAVSFMCIHRNIKESEDIYQKISRFFQGNQAFLYRNHPIIFNEVHKIVLESDTIGGFLPALHFLELLLAVSDWDHETASEKFTEYANPYEKNPPDIQRMMALDGLIEMHYTGDFKRKDFADRLYISSRQLDRIVQKRYGKSLRSVLMEKRIETSKKMLLSTDFSVGTIAVAVGFENGNGFYKEFSKYTGFTPAQYRKHYRKEI